MTRRKVIIMVAVSVTLLLFATSTGIWNPHRWIMYRDAMSEAGPISFYGQVLDLTGTPVPGVTVTLDVRKPNPYFILGAEPHLSDQRYVLVTDHSGRFQIDNERGKSLRIREFNKPGYEFVPRIVGGGNWDTSFHYFGGGGRGAPHKPDPNKPVPFEMRKLP